MATQSHSYGIYEWLIPFLWRVCMGNSHSYGVYELSSVSYERDRCSALCTGGEPLQCVPSEVNENENQSLTLLIYSTEKNRKLSKPASLARCGLLLVPPGCTPTLVTICTSITRAKRINRPFLVILRWMALAGTMALWALN
jgi:hypothetical protein